MTDSTTSQKLESMFDEVRVAVQPTPNPSAYKFMLNREVKAGGKISFHSTSECRDVELAKELFALPGVIQVHFFENVITLTFIPEFYSLAIENQVIQKLQELLPRHNPQFGPQELESSRRMSLSPELQEIEAILDRTIRPGLQSDGGDIEVLRLENKDLYVRYQGACGSCPSSTMGTLMAIEGILCDEFDTEIKVIPENVPVEANSSPNS